MDTDDSDVTAQQEAIAQRWIRRAINELGIREKVKQHLSEQFKMVSLVESKYKCVFHCSCDAWRV